MSPDTDLYRFRPRRGPIMLGLGRACISDPISVLVGTHDGASACLSTSRAVCNRPQNSTAQRDLTLATGGMIGLGGKRPRSVSKPRSLWLEVKR